jgi:hypothetical protein
MRSRPVVVYSDDIPPLGSAGQPASVPTHVSKAASPGSINTSEGDGDQAVIRLFIGGHSNTN